MKTRAILIVFVLSGFLFFDSRPVFAAEKVYEPYVSKGEIEVEARGSYDLDHAAEKDRLFMQKYAVGYGVTDKWFTEVYGEWEKVPGEETDESNSGGTHFESVEWENRFQLTEQGQYWVDVGLYTAYEFGIEDDVNDKAEVKLLLEKSVGNFSHVLNLILEQDIVQGSELEGGFAWSTRYRWKPWLEPGVEIQSDFGELGHMGSFSEQKHQVGPVIYGRVGQIRYDIGYLFGVSDAAPDGEFKWIVEWEHWF